MGVPLLHRPSSEPNPGVAHHEGCLAPTEGLEPRSPPNSAHTHPNDGPREEAHVQGGGRPRSARIPRLAAGRRPDHRLGPHPL